MRNTSKSTYPTDFGKALQNLLTERQQNIFNIIGGVGDALVDPSAGGIPEVKTYFTSYTQAIIANATESLSSWTGKTGVYMTTSTSRTAAAANTTTTYGRYGTGYERSRQNIGHQQLKFHQTSRCSGKLPLLLSTHISYRNNTYSIQCLL